MNNTIENYLQNSHHMSMQDMLKTTHDLIRALNNDYAPQLSAQTIVELQKQVNADLANLWIYDYDDTIMQIEENLRTLVNILH